MCFIIGKKFAKMKCMYLLTIHCCAVELHSYVAVCARKTVNFCVTKYDKYLGTSMINDVILICIEPSGWRKENYRDTQKKLSFIVFIYREFIILIKKGLIRRVALPQSWKCNYWHYLIWFQLIYLFYWQNELVTSKFQTYHILFS